MKLFTKSRFLLIVCLIGLSVVGHAQDGLQIKNVFERYGKQKGSTMVELTDGSLGAFQFSLFKSLVIENNNEATDFVRQCLSSDEKGAKKVKQVVSNGVVTSEYLQLQQKNGIYRLILFNDLTRPNEKVTLIYIETKNNSDEILKYILKKK